MRMMGADEASSEGREVRRYSYHTQKEQLTHEWKHEMPRRHERLPEHELDPSRGSYSVYSTEER